MELRPYQEDLLKKITSNTNQRICVQLATGGGKTVIFTTLAKQYDGRVLILVDSRELVGQTAKHFTDASTFEAKDKVFPKTKIVVSMVQTLKSRLKKYPNLIADFDLIIIDECHVIIYEKILEIANCKIIGFTATPVSNRKDNYFFCFNYKVMNKIQCDCCEKIEFTKDFVLADLFHDIIVGIPIGDLITDGFLVVDENYAIPIEEDDFKFDAFGEVSNSEEVFNAKYQMDVLANYNEYCKGKKTMIFTQNTTLNKFIYDLFVEACVPNCLMYDSVNESDYSRSEVVEKFRNTDGAILFNVGVFTKGFDVTDVEAIIVSRRVSSLNLYIQILGRGSRTTNKIFKDRFIHIDGGGNIARFGRWSDTFDWEKIFWGTDDYKAKKEPTDEEVTECDNCGELMKERTCICPACDHNNCKIKEIKINEGLAIQQNIVPPDGKKIIEYCQKIDKDKIFALKILTSQIYQMFKKVPKEQFISNRNTGVERVLNTHLKLNYFKILQTDLPSCANRTLKRQKEILINKLEKKYKL